MAKTPPSSSQIQFISAEEMRKAAELEKEGRQLRTVDGMMDKMSTAFENADCIIRQQTEDQMGLMEHWALRNPGQFFNLQAKLAMHKQANETAQKIFIGLPMTELDDPGE